MKSRLKILPILIIVMLILQFLLPIVSNADDIELQEAEKTLKVELKRDESNSNQVNITATDTKYNIEELKYVHKRIELSEISYFEENNSDVKTIEITPSQNIKASFMMDGYGTYTVYAKNAHGDRFLARITIHDPGEVPDLTLIKNENNPLSLTIQAISKNSEISIIKIAKLNDINEDIDFNTEGTNIEFTKSSNVNLVYKVTEEGLYEVYAKDEKGASITKQIYLSKNKTPIDVTITDLGNREVSLNVTDSICNITKIKVAKASEISDFDDFETKGEDLSFTEGRTVNVNYTAPEDGTYTFFIEDEAGYRKMVDERITSTENPMEVTITQDSEKPGKLTIKATDTASDIVELKVAIGEDITMGYFENNGESLSITPGKEVTANYQVEENCVLNVYIKDADGYTHLTRKTIIVSTGPTQNEPPQITLTQNQSNPRQIDVTVSDPDNYIDTIKWAEGSHDANYFKSNGNRIGQGQLGKIITTEFTIDMIGTYTVYAEDQDGASSVEEINILSLDKVEEPDTTAPIISGVTDNAIYKNSVTPSVSDENLDSVTLTKDGAVVSNYKNGDIISEEGNYILTAKDKAGNETVVNFTIDFTAPEIEITQENTDSKNVAVTINLKDNLTGIDILKVASGEQNESYFENGGQQINIIKDGLSAIGKINVTKNGVYSAYVRDLAGNVKVQTFEVTTIDEGQEPEPEPEPDTTAPAISIEKAVSQDKTSVNLTINVVDTESQIQIVKMANGERDTNYFTNNGTELQMKKEDKTSTSIVNITQNGIYTIYAEDEAGNKVVKTIDITEIEEKEPEPEPEPDTLPPTIAGVEDGKTYRNYVTPIASDENLAQVILIKDGNIVENYTNGDQIRENGSYVLIATDEAGNRTQVSFKIDIKDEDTNEGNNTNTDGNTNTNPGTNTNPDTNNSNNEGNDNTNTDIDNPNTNGSTDGNANNNQQGGANRPSGSTNRGSSGSSTSGGIQNSQGGTTATGKLPYAGLRNALIFVIIALIGVSGYTYMKYRKYSKF